MSEMSQGTASEPGDQTVWEVPRRCLVVDATPSLQGWVDDFYTIMAAAEKPGGKPELPDGIVVVTVAALWRAVEAAFGEDGEPWSIVENGWPTLPDPHEVGPGDFWSELRRLICRLRGGC
ncbi:MAG: hypothetical protein QM582_08120 [Micropruina sp.]|uniref:hypothetical protein n=1 Tax=Micropruina sp. TaxID=2737536 RepID=UPI0039E6E2A1